MAVVWIVENPTPNSSGLTRLVCGIAAVRAFASVRSLVRVSACDPIPAGAAPRVILVDQTQLPDAGALTPVARELCNIFARNGWPEPAVVLVGSGAEPLEYPVAASISAHQAVDCVRQLISISRDPVSVARQLRSGDLLLDLDGCRVSCIACGAKDSLSPTESRLLRALLEQGEAVATRKTVMDAVWGGTRVAARTLDAHVSRLRKRIEFTGMRIESSYGDGYRLTNSGGCEAARGRLTASRGGSTSIGRAAKSV
ncbi:MAG: phosphate regulon transcriptional regulatory protein PhoB [Pseudomonadota bacterium]